MATMNIHTVLTLFFATVACEASAIKGLGTGWQTGIPVMTDTQGNTSPPDISRPALPILPSTQSAASDAGANLPPMPIAQAPATSLPRKSEGLGIPISTSPKEETPGLAVFSMLARIPGYDERCNMQATTAKARCQSKPGGKRRHRRWYLDPTSKKCLASCDKKAPFRYKVHCDAICRTEKACHFSATGFPCVIKYLHPVFIYNQTQKKCVKGYDCDYYGNKFVTLRECEKTCVKGGLQAQKQVTITAGMSNEPSNQIPTSVPPNDDLPAPPLPGASFGQVITGNQVAAGSAQNQVTIGGSTSQASVQGPSSDLGGTPVESTLSSTQSSSQASVHSQSAMSTSGQQQTQTPAAVPSGPAIQVTQVVTEGTQQTAGGAEASSQASLQTRTSISTQGQQPAQTPTAVPPGPGPQVPQVDTGGFPPQSTTGAGATSQVSTQTQNSLSIISQQQRQRPSGVATKPGLQGHQILKEKPSSSAATSAPQTTSQGSSSGSPVRHEQVSRGSGIHISSELEIVAAGTGPRRNQVTTESRPSDTSEESLSLDLGLGGPRRPLNIAGATSVSRTLNRVSNFGLPPRLGPVSPQSGAIVRPELEIVGVGSGRMRRPPSGPRANRRTTGTGLTSISGKPGNLGVGVAPPRVPSTSGQSENQPGGTRVPHIPGEAPGASLVAGQRQPSSPVAAPIVPGLDVPGAATSRGPTISSGTNALITGSTPIPGIHHPGLSVQPGLGGPEITGTSKEGPVKTGTIGPQAPSVPLHTVAPMLQKPSFPLTIPLNQNVLQQTPTTQKIGISEEGPVKTGTIGPQAPSFPVLPVAPVLRTPSLPLTPPLNQNLQKRPPTQKIGTSKEGPVKTGTSGPQAPSVPLHSFAPMPQKPSLPLTPPLNQNLLQQRPTTQKIGISHEGPVKSGTIGPQAPSFPVLPAAPVLQTPSLPLTPPLNQHLLQKPQVTQKIATSEEGPVKTATKGPQTPSLPVHPVAPVPQKPSLPPTPPLSQTLLQQRPTTQKGGTREEGAVKTGTSGPLVPSLPVSPVAPVLPKPNLPAAPPLNQIVIQKRPTKQKIESQITTGSQAISKGSLNDKRLVKRIQKGGNEGIQMSVSEDELPLPTGPLNEPPLKGFSLTTLPNLPTMAKLPGLLKIKTVRK